MITHKSGGEITSGFFNSDMPPMELEAVERIGSYPDEPSADLAEGSSVADSLRSSQGGVREIRVEVESVGQLWAGNACEGCMSPRLLRRNANLLRATLRR